MIAYRSRILLISLAKQLPFVVCGIVCISYIESIYSLMTLNIDCFGHYAMIVKPLSWVIGNLFVYDWYTIIVLSILAIAMSTCIWNRLAILYLALHLVFKQYIEQIELYEYQVYLLCITNIVITTFLIIKGIKTLKGGT